MWTILHILCSPVGCIQTKTNIFVRYPVVYIAVKKPVESYKWVIIESMTAEMFFFIHSCCQCFMMPIPLMLYQKMLCLKTEKCYQKSIEVKVTLEFRERIKSTGSIWLSILVLFFHAFSFWSVVYCLYHLHSVPPFGSEIYFDIDVVSMSLGTFLYSVFSNFKK